MNSISTETFVAAIHAMHDATALLRAKEHVHEKFDGQAVWTGEVLTFELSDHPTASRCFAWEVDGEVTAVLAEGPIQTPVDAVRASIVGTDWPASP